MEIKENIQGLETGNAKVIALTKDVPAREIKEAMNAGITEIGERYLDEAKEKFRQLGKRVKWHFVGNIKLKEAKELVGIFDVIQTISTLKEAKAINWAAEGKEKIQKVMVRVNMSGDGYGVEPEDVISFYNELTGMRHLEIIGLMTESDPHNPVVGFKKLKNLNSKLKLRFLSMGTSKNYKDAIANGSNMVRIGDAIFNKGVESPLDELMSHFFGFFRKLFGFKPHTRKIL